MNALTPIRRDIRDIRLSGARFQFDSAKQYLRGLLDIWRHDRGMGRAMARALCQEAVASVRSARMELAVCQIESGRFGF